MTQRRGFSLCGLIMLVAACSSGDRPGETGIGLGDQACQGQCQSSLSTDAASLSTAEVARIIAQAALEASAQQTPATIAVVDRVGNVLGVYRMQGADTFVLVGSQRQPPVNSGLDGIRLVPDTLAAISKAITGAYLSSEGNAFGTRTANQIVQEHFNPGEFGQPSGPLFGVQFSQLACSDLNLDINDGLAGPKRSPLGLAADPGGLPLYKNGTVVGGIGVIADGVYGGDLNIIDQDRDPDELIAVAGSFGFAAPRDRRGDRITVEGKTFRFSDVDFNDTASAGQTAPPLAEFDGELLSVRGYKTDPALTSGLAFTGPGSGYAPASDPRLDGLDAFVLVDQFGAERFPAQGEPGGMSETEVVTVLRHALGVANRARAQIRRPLNTPARVTISVVGRDGQVLGLVRSRDAPVFGTDVSLQKARTALFFSSAGAAAALQAAGSVTYLRNDAVAASDQTVVFADYLAAAQDLLGPQALTGTHAFADRSGGNLSRPFFPDGLTDRDPGPFSKTFDRWSPFSTGLQLDLIYERVIQHVAFVLDLAPDDVSADGCAGPPADGPVFSELLGFNTTVPAQLNNGMQIFPGSVPIYRGDELVGGIGVSGDGVDQDDMVAFLGLHEAGEALAGAIGNAPVDRRADTLMPGGSRLRYVQCPQAPFIEGDDQNVCEGK